MRNAKLPKGPKKPERANLTLYAALFACGATDAVLAEYATELRVPVIPPCEHAAKVGRRLDCVLAHLEDVHRWKPDQLARWMGASR